MRWGKLGQVFCPENARPWMLSHAATPVAEPLGGDRFRIYFTCRDARNRSHIGSLELDLRAPQRILHLDEAPLVAPGTPGLFDDSGSAMGCLQQLEGETRLYYLGWNLGVTVPWRNSIGVAIRRPGEAGFTKASPAPVLDRNPVDPYTLSYPWILRDGAAWRMWYGSNLRWGADQADMDHVIKEAGSVDGLAWQPTGRIAIGLAAPGEYAMARPCVLRDDGLYRMWYAYRGAAYRIGYAESTDGVAWQRRNEQVGITVSESGWDAEMIEYASVFDHNRERYMLYNGARFGKTGFGLAILEQD